MRLPDPARSYAVLIGTSTYGSTELDDLPAVEGNLNDLYEALTDPLRGALPADHCRVVLNPPTAEAVSEELHRCAELAEDTLVLYFAGHGLPGLRGEDLYLATADTKPGNLRFSALRYDDVRDVFLDRGRFPATNRVVILDCCFSGRAIPKTMSSADVVGMIGIEGTYILTATRGHVPALALSEDGLHTVFTGKLIRLLRNGISGGPELLTLDAIYNHILKTMREFGLPLPDQINRETVGNLALARNSAYAIAAAPTNGTHTNPESTMDDLGRLPPKAEPVAEEADRIEGPFSVAMQRPRTRQVNRDILGLTVGATARLDANGTDSRPGRGRKFVRVAAVVLVIACGFLATMWFGLFGDAPRQPYITAGPNGEKGVPSGPQAVTAAPLLPATGGSGPSAAPPQPDSRPTMPAPTAVAETGRTELHPGQQLAPGEQLHSPDGRFVLVMQPDGNLVQRAPGNQPVWSSNTFRPNSVALMQPDGNFVVIAPGNAPVWATGTSRYPNSVLRVQNDGNVVVYSPGHVPRWSSFDHGSQLSNQ